MISGLSRSNSNEARFKFSPDYGRGDNIGGQIHSAKEAGEGGEECRGEGQDEGIRLATAKGRREARRNFRIVEEKGIDGDGELPII